MTSICTVFVVIVILSFYAKCIDLIWTIFTPPFLLSQHKLIFFLTVSEILLSIASCIKLK